MQSFCLTNVLLDLQLGSEEKISVGPEDFPPPPPQSESLRCWETEPAPGHFWLQTDSVLGMLREVTEVILMEEEVGVGMFSAVVSTERPRVAGTSPVWVSLPGSSGGGDLHWMPVWAVLWCLHLTRDNNIDINTRRRETSPLTSAGWCLSVSVSEEILDWLSLTGGGADGSGEQEEEEERQWQQWLGNNWSLKLPPQNILLFQISGFCFYCRITDSVGTGLILVLSHKLDLE